MAATATQTIISASISRPIHAPSQFLRVSVKLNHQSTNYSAAAVSPKRRLAIVAATKKAVVVLKGTSDVHRVVTLTQDDDGLLIRVVAQATLIRVMDRI